MHIDKYLRMNVQGELFIIDSADGTEVSLVDHYRSKDDERLGRWRWPEYPGYVVYPHTVDLRPSSARGRGVTVLDEALPRLYTVWEGRAEEFAHLRKDSGNQMMARHAAEAYFEAHPAPKPAWHDAKPGEVWELSFLPDTLDTAAYVAGDWLFVGQGHGVPKVDSRIESARRIWPELAS
ncbi:hypothetical protein AB0230_01695 [Microbacterium sp. NPDC089190]|uniref:hypothetical protein n=1 Tax=Microbacterium sp. NPDC089190 TaxID=3155063 RepID=UPI00344E028A